MCSLGNASFASRNKKRGYIKIRDEKSEKVFSDQK
jgi:hypothetical protein